MNTIRFTYRPLHHSHTHWQAPQAGTQTKACKRLCLPHPEKKQLKIPFPSKNFKSTNSQSDTETFGKLVAKLNKDRGYKTLTTGAPACNSTYPKGGVSFPKDRFVDTETFALLINICDESPTLWVAANR